MNLCGKIITQSGTKVFTEIHKEENKFKNIRMKIIAVIPARYASTRFPAKLMEDLEG